MTRIAPQQAYTVLGVTPEDDFATIRKAWVRLVKENHPDALGGDTDTATQRLGRINDAYDSLRWHSPEKLRIYKEREDQRRLEARDKRARQEQARRLKPATEEKAGRAPHGDTPPAPTPGRPGIAARALRKYREVQEICDHTADAIMVRSA